MINRVPQMLNKEVPRQIAETAQQVRALKTKQFIGGDSVVTDQTPDNTFTVTLAAGAIQVLIINLYATHKVRYLSEVKPLFFIGTDLNPNFAWPYGSSISPSQFQTGPPFCDLGYSDELGVGNKSYILMMKNTSGSSYTLYVHYAILFTKQALNIA